MMIRSQDGTNFTPLGKVSLFSFALGDEPTAILNDGDIMGRYESEARCMEVLDEIQNAFQYSNHYSGSGVNSSDCQDWTYGVFQMPEK